MNRIASRVHRPRDPEIRNLLKTVGIEWPEPPPKELPQDEYADETAENAEENGENEDYTEEGEEEDEAFEEDEVIEPPGGGGIHVNLTVFTSFTRNLLRNVRIVGETMTIFS